MDWLLWGLLLLLQNASFTWVSRARNSGSVAYNGIASVFSNGIWFIGQLVIVNKIVEYKNSPLMLTVCAVFYTIWCVTGSMGSQYVLMKYVEKGKRKVGA